LKPTTPEQILLTTLARKVESLRQLAEDVLMEMPQLRADPAPDLEAVRARMQLKQRQLVMEAGDTVLQLRMAASEGSAMANQVWSPVAGFEDLPEELAKNFKELKKEQAKAAKAQQPRGGGGPHRGYQYRGRGGYQPYVMPQQMPVMAIQPMQSQQGVWPMQPPQQQQMV